MNMFNLEINSTLSDILYLEREYQFFLNYQEFLSSNIPQIANHAESRMVTIARNLARGYNRVYNIYPVPPRVESTVNYKPRLVKN